MCQLKFRRVGVIILVLHYHGQQHPGLNRIVVSSWQNKNRGHWQGENRKDQQEIQGATAIVAKLPIGNGEQRGPEGAGTGTAVC